jgi:hypothetical protein
LPREAAPTRRSDLNGAHASFVPVSETSKVERLNLLLMPKSTLALSLAKKARARADVLAPMPLALDAHAARELRDALTQARAALSAVEVQLRRARRALPPKS